MADTVDQALGQRASGHRFDTPACRTCATLRDIEHGVTVDR